MPKALFVPDPAHKIESDQVWESVPVGVLVEYEGMEWNPTHTPANVGELCLAS